MRDLPDHRRIDRHRRHAGRIRARRRVLLEYRAHQELVSWISGTTVFDPSVYYLTKLPAEIDPHETGGIVVMALVLSVLATIYPSWKASRLDPVEALRYE